MKKNIILVIVTAVFTASVSFFVFCGINSQVVPASSCGISTTEESNNSKVLAPCCQPQ